MKDKKGLTALDVASGDAVAVLRLREEAHDMQYDDKHEAILKARFNVLKNAFVFRRDEPPRKTARGRLLESRKAEISRAVQDRLQRLRSLSDPPDYVLNEGLALEQTIAGKPRERLNTQT